MIKVDDAGDTCRQRIFYDEQRSSRIVKNGRKSNEITAMSELLKILDLKGNQGKLYPALEENFPVKCINAPELESVVAEEKNHADRKPDCILSVI